MGRLLSYSHYFKIHNYKICFYAEKLVHLQHKNRSIMEIEETFPIRCYGRGELALLYLPHVQQRSALKSFNEWLERAPGLMASLEEAGYTPTSRRYTPAQVRLIVDALGEP